jgi:ATP-dependent helicase HrpA
MDELSVGAKIAQCLVQDSAILTRQWRTLLHQSSPQDSPAWLRFMHQLDAAYAKMLQRAAAMPTQLEFPNLPILTARQTIEQAIVQHQVVIIAGSTGSGKSTQLAKLCLALGQGRRGWIGHTQPRRIAARSIAAQVAKELNCPVGDKVGYKIRFHEKVAPSSYIKLMTDGILLQELENDQALRRYDTLIIDEAHEHSLNIDFILGYLKKLLSRRPDLKIIITSATIETEKLSQFFHGAPIIDIPGKLYPIELNYLPVPQHEDRGQHLINTVLEINRQGPGDILVFLSGEREIIQTAKKLNEQVGLNCDVIMLYARLNWQAQRQVFQSHTRRRVILATNIAETSLTVPNIVYVIDNGLARISRYSYRSKIQQLLIEPISQASCQQRSGRCGRVAPGICYRLFSEEDYLTRDLYTQPEILRTHLASVLLKMHALQLGPVADFPFLDKPDPRYLKDAQLLLTQLEALSGTQLTAIGQAMARLPIEPKLARVMLAAAKLHCLTEIMVIISGISIQDPRERLVNFKAQADLAHRQFQDPRSDFISLWRLWTEFKRQQQALSQRGLQKYCQQNYLSLTRLLEWQDIEQQLTSYAKKLALPFNSSAASYNEIHQALLSGFATTIGLKDEDPNYYLGPRGIKFKIFPGSGVLKKKPKWLVSFALIQTKTVYAHTVAAIEPQWLEQFVPHLIKKSYFEPHWVQALHQVSAYEKVMLFGLPIIAKRRVNYGPIDPRVAQQIFIDEALVNARVSVKLDFLTHNLQLIEKIQALEARTRCHDLLIAADQLAVLYAEQLPANIYNLAQLKQWLALQPGKPLHFSQAQLLNQALSAEFAQQYPTTLLNNRLSLNLKYHYAVEDERDGVTVELPVTLLNHVSAKEFTWLIPGWLAEKVTLLLKKMPKEYRRNLPPLPQLTQAALSQIQLSQGTLQEALAQFLSKNYQVSKPWLESELALDLPPYLLMRFAVYDEAQQCIASGRSLAQLKAKVKAQYPDLAPESVCTNIPELAVLTQQWCFGELPAQVCQVKAQREVIDYPALVDHQTGVQLELFPSMEQATAAHQLGLTRLLYLNCTQTVNYLRKHLVHAKEIKQRTPFKEPAPPIIEQIIWAALYWTVVLPQPLAYSKAEFNAYLADGSQALIKQANFIATQVMATLRLYSELKLVSQRLQRNAPPWLNQILAEVTAQQLQLMGPEFVQQTPYTWLKRLPIYFKGMLIRLDKAVQNPAQAQSLTAKWLPWQQKWQTFNAQYESLTRLQQQKLAHIGWLLEEYKISLFAQQLGTCESVSPKKIQRLFNLVHS